MRFREHDPAVQYNWVAILSYAASIAVSIAIWTGVIRGLHILVK